VLGLSACGGVPGDVGVVRLGLGGEPQPHAQSRVLYLAFGGATLMPGSDNAPVNMSSLVTSATTIPAFDPAVAAPRVAAADVHEVVFERVKSLLAPYALTVTDSRPASGAFTMVVLGGGHALLNRSVGVAGLAPIDCTDSDASDVGFVFAGDIDAVHGGVVAVANTAAHEAAHTFGLEHVGEVADLMFAADPVVRSPTLPGLFSLAFTDGATYSSYVAGGLPQAEQCGRADPLDNHALLVAALGASTPGADVTPPTLSWVSPISDSVLTSQPVEVNAADASGIARVELYRNLELWAVLRGPTYAAVVDGEGGVGYYLTAVAVDTAGVRSVDSRWVVPMWPPDASMPIDFAGSDGATDGGMGPLKTPGCGCEVGGSSSMPVLPTLALFAAMLLWNRRRQRRIGDRRR